MTEPTSRTAKKKRRKQDRATELKAANGVASVLAVGVSEYDVRSGFHRLRQCTFDAKQVADCFRINPELHSSPERVQELTSAGPRKPSRGNIVADVRHLATNASSDDRIIFYFSGHGQRIDDQLYLVPEDAWTSDDPEALVSVSKVSELLSASLAKVKILILDACNTGADLTHIKHAAATWSERFLAEYVQKTEGVVVLASSLAEQTSSTKSPNKDLSLFTNFIVNALNGDADALDNGLLTVDSLFGYVSAHVQRVSTSHHKFQQPTVAASHSGLVLLGDFRDGRRAVLETDARVEGTPTEEQQKATGSGASVPRNTGWRRLLFLVSAAALAATGIALFAFRGGSSTKYPRFGESRTYRTGSGPRALAIADLNRDGHVDIATANAIGNSVSVLFGNGDGTFRDAVSYGTVSQPRSLAVAELDGSNGPDIIVPSGNDASVAILRNLGDGTFDTLTRMSTGPKPEQNQSYEDTVTVADFNRDGRPDLGISRYVDGSLVVFLSKGNGMFALPSDYRLSTQNSISSLIADDFDGDGAADIAVADFREGVRIARNRGDGTFLPSFAQFPAEVNRIASADLNGDGRPDIVTATYDSPYIYGTIVMNMGGGSFSPGLAFRSSVSPRRGAFAVALGRRKKAAPFSVVAANANSSSVTVFDYVREGEVAERETIPTGAAPVAVVMADLNGDGVADIVTANTDDSTVSVILGMDR
jgi:hypothetical protein